MVSKEIANYRESTSAVKSGLCFAYSINELTPISPCVDIEAECPLILAFVFILGIIIQNTREKFLQLFVSS